MSARSRNKVNTIEMKYVVTSIIDNTLFTVCRDGLVARGSWGRL